MIKEMKKQDETERKAFLPEYAENESKPRFSERLARNMALAGMIVLTVTAMRNAELPSGDTVLTAVRQIVETDWGEGLGKIRFVTNLLPETTAVFFSDPLDCALTAPCFGESTHPWSESEPYLAYRPENQLVYAAADGEVMSIAHGPEEERILRIRHTDSIETMYYNLSEIRVREGDQVTPSTCLGTVQKGKEAVFEVRRAGSAVEGHPSPRTP